MSIPFFSKPSKLTIAVTLSAAVAMLIWIMLIAQQESVSQLISDFSGFTVLGVFGAIAANATGAGGGVVFVPAFKALGLEIEQVIATSFAIQCFGMSVGSLSWLLFFRSNQHSGLESNSLLFKTLCWAIPASIIGLYSVQYAGLQAFTDIHTKFNIFSFVFGIAVLWHCYILGAKTNHRGITKLTNIEVIIIVIGCFLGGVITAWISVGVGEVLAVLLLLRRFSVMFSVAAGVMVSAVTVIAGIPFFILADEIHTDIIMFAVPGAMIGAFIARYIALWLGPKKLKFLLGSWILLVGLYGLVM